MKFEMEIRQGKKNKILIEILKEVDKEKCNDSSWVKERRKYLERNGLSEEGLKEKIKEGANVLLELSETDYENQRQFQHNKIQSSTYNSNYKTWVLPDIPFYLKEGRRIHETARRRCQVLAYVINF